MLLLFSKCLRGLRILRPAKTAQLESLGYFLSGEYNAEGGTAVVVKQVVDIKNAFAIREF